MVILSVIAVFLSMGSLWADDEHEDLKHEIGIASGLPFFIKENTFSASVHLHYSYKFLPKVSVGLSMEYIFLNLQHISVGPMITISPSHKLSFNLSPSVTFEEDLVPTFLMHFETLYNMRLSDRVHIAPLLSFALDPNDIHVELGIHFAFEL